MKVFRYVFPVLGLLGFLAASPAVAQSNAHHARISLETARATALERVPGTVQSEELEYEGHRWIYSFEIVPAQPTRPGIEEVNVDADTGTIVSVEHEAR
jgi:uncharacterized membrane protein YkoI